MGPLLSVAQWNLELNTTDKDVHLATDIPIVEV